MFFCFDTNGDCRGLLPAYRRRRQIFISGRVVVVVAAVAVVVAVAVAVAVVADVDQSRMHAHSSVAHSFIGVSLMSPGTWSAISSATLVSVAHIELVFFPDCPTLDHSANFPWETKTIRLPWKVCRKIGRGAVGEEDQVDFGNAYQGRG